MFRKIIDWFTGRQTVQEQAQSASPPNVPAEPPSPLPDASRPASPPNVPAEPPSPVPGTSRPASPPAAPVTFPRSLPGASRLASPANVSARFPRSLPGAPRQLSEEAIRRYLLRISNMHKSSTPFDYSPFEDMYEPIGIDEDLLRHMSDDVCLDLEKYLREHPGVVNNKWKILSKVMEMKHCSDYVLTLLNDPRFSEYVDKVFLDAAKNGRDDIVYVLLPKVDPLMDDNAALRLAIQKYHELVVYTLLHDERVREGTNYEAVIDFALRKWPPYMSSGTKRKCLAIIKRLESLRNDKQADMEQVIEVSQPE